jgi:predicted enzyme related to lactoylglutathione lyase
VTPSRIRHITIDCRDPHLLARFWADVLGFADDPDNPNEPGDPEALIVDPTGHAPGLLFLPVPEPKTGKNRVHLDLQPSRRRDDEVERVLALGGAVVADHRTPDGAGWVVMADPEGNELCVERSAAERGTPAPHDTGMRRMTFDRAAGERTLLESMLEWYRDGVLRKVDGVRDHHARTSPVRSGTTIAGIVKHLAAVEDGWFSTAFAGHPEPEPWASVDWDADPDWEWRTATGEPLAASVELYRAACERSRGVVAAHRLDDVGADRIRPPFTLRFAMLHLVEETARHLGHIDILREHLDGTTGD